MSYFRMIVDRKYSKIRHVQEGIDRGVSDMDIVEFLFRRLVQRLRAVVRRIPGGFVGPGVKLAHRRHLTTGPGVVIGRGAAIDALAQDGVQLAAGVTVGDFAVVKGSGVIRKLGQGVVVGSHTSIGVNNFIHGGGGVSIGRDCLLGPSVSVFSENHVFSDVDIPIREQGETPAPVVIEDNVWIGAGSTVLAGVTVGEGSVVAAGSVVTRDVPRFTIVGGTPAKIIGGRK